MTSVSPKQRGTPSLPEFPLPEADVVCQPSVMSNAAVRSESCAPPHPNDNNDKSRLNDKAKGRRQIETLHCHIGY